MLARWLYALVLQLTVPFLLLRLQWRGRRQPAYRRHIGERFGFYAGPPAQASLWLHAVSVGEMRAAEPLVAALRARWPEHRLLLTCTTPTGRETARQLYGDDLSIAYLPYDLPGAVTRFFAAYQPQCGILMETELWPNLLAAARQRGLPIVLANARLSTRSARGYARVGALARPAFATLAAVAAQSAADAARLQALGAGHVSVCGNLKFDVTPSPQRLALGASWRADLGTRPVWLAASTREGEEAIVLAAFRRLRATDALLILVPRHPQRFAEVAAAARASGLAVRCRSEGAPLAPTQVWIGDSMGEMPAYYACADLALIGGSLLPYGSQNLIEACACGCPVLIGPSDFNFAQASADALAAGAARRVGGDAPGLAEAVDELLHDPVRRAEMRTAALSFAAAHRGATARTLAVIAAVLAAPSATASR